MQAIKYICLGIILGISLTWGWTSCSARKADPVPVVSALAGVSQQQAPFAVIYDFYQALEESRTDQLAVLVTPKFLTQLKENQGALQCFERLEEDPSLRFAFFLITEQELDLQSGQARVKGTAEWVSATKGAFSIPQTITIINLHGKWKINSIEETV
ncbi:MAG: hypothetical protein GX039_06930 [Clostridia bacterium]|nr:hypothetical protein [Clostridia bacterium]